MLRAQGPFPTHLECQQLQLSLLHFRSPLACHLRPQSWGPPKSALGVPSPPRVPPICSMPVCFGCGCAITSRVRVSRGQPHPLKRRREGEGRNEKQTLVDRREMFRVGLPSARALPILIPAHREKPSFHQSETEISQGCHAPCITQTLGGQRRQPGGAHTMPCNSPQTGWETAGTTAFKSKFLQGPRTPSVRPSRLCEESRTSRSSLNVLGTLLLLTLSFPVSNVPRYTNGSGDHNPNHICQ